MQILRLPPYPLFVTYSVPEANTLYSFVIEDVENQSITQDSVLSDDNFKVTYQLPSDFSKYDKSYYLAVYEVVSEGILSDDPVVEDNLEINRPYIDPSTLGKTASEIAKYNEYEGIARTIIDNVTGGFYNKRVFLEVVGQGTDYIPLWERTNKILKVYENAELVYDASLPTPAIGSYNYLITKDKTAITKDPANYVDAINRAERLPPRFTLAPSDSFAIFDTEDSGNVYTVVGGVGFMEGWDYILQLETGYRVVPYDIQDATKMLINDIECGKLDYYKRYVKNYRTDQFEIEYDERMIDGTGNIMVDKILAKYVVSMPSPKVL